MSQKEQVLNSAAEMMLKPLLISVQKGVWKTDLEGRPGASLMLEQLSSSSVIWNVSDVSSSGHLVRKSSCN